MILFSSHNFAYIFAGFDKDAVLVGPALLRKTTTISLQFLSYIFIFIHHIIW